MSIQIAQPPVSLPTTLNRRRFLQITAAVGALTLAGGAFIASRPTAPVTHSAARTLMGTHVHLTVVADDSRHAEDAIEATFAAMQRLIAIFDHRQPSTALSQLNQHGVVDAPPLELVDLLRRAVQYSELSAGAFDVTVKPLLDARRQGQTDLTALRHLVDFRQIEIAEDRVRLGIPGASITLDGIAKGQVIDAAVTTLRQLGFGQVLVEAGGDLRTLSTRADDSPWRVGIAHPRSATPGAVLAVLPVTGQAVATSGDYMNSFAADFSQHHIVDPRSGDSPLELASATVIAPTALDADALGTALMVLGARDGLSLAEQLPAVEAVLVTKDLRILKTPGVVVD